MNTKMKRGIVMWFGTAALVLLLLVVINITQNQKQNQLEAGELDPLWPAPDFMLTNQAGEITTLEDLRGQVWAANFFFTTCPGICPMLAQKMMWLSDEIADHPQRDEMRLVSFSLDPQNDTVEVLSDYAEAVDALPSEWLYLTGSNQVEMWGISEGGFKLAVAETPDDPVNPITHTGKIVLVDRDGQVRGYYEGLTPDGVKQLKRDMLRLVQEQ